MNKEIRIKLDFDKATTRLAFYPYGQSVYNEQVASKIDFDADKIYIEFPEQIVKAASSFVQGFFEEIIAKLGYSAIGEKIIVESSNDSLVESVMDNLV